MAGFEQRHNLAGDDLAEVLAVDVRLEGFRGVVLLVHHDQVRFVERAVRHVEVATRLGAGWNRSLVQQLDYVVDMSWFDLESGDDGEHKRGPFCFKSNRTAFRAKILA